MKSKFVVAGVIAFIVGIVVTSFILGQDKPNTKQTNHSDTNQQEEAKPTPTSARSHMAVFGNAFWGRNTNDWSQASPLKYKYPFSRLNEFEREKYDAWIAGLECPTDPSVNTTAAQQEEKLEFNCRPEYLPEAAKWFTAFTLANNHTDNQGKEGFEVTKKELDKNGIQYFGNYDPKVIDDACEVVSLPVEVAMSDNHSKKGNLPIAFCAYHGVFEVPSKAALAEITKYSKAMPVIAMPHMGAEYEPEPDELKTNLYRQMIDSGADMVLGDHPHWVQSSESYQGRLIAYSMGNFMFDQQGNLELTRSAGFDIVLDVKNPDLEKWLELGEKCKSFKDNCLEEAKGLKLLAPSFKFDVIATRDNEKITHKATDTERQSILDRLRWNQTINGLKSPYGSQ